MQGGNGKGGKGNGTEEISGQRWIGDETVGNEKEMGGRQRWGEQAKRSGEAQGKGAMEKVGETRGMGRKWRGTEGW